MKRIFSLILCSISLIGSLSACNEKSTAPPPVGGGSTTGSEPEYDVFLLIGQSNMAGRGTMVAGDELPFHANVYLLNTDGEPEPATNPLNQYSTVRKDIKHQQINPGFSFSKIIAEETGHKILLVVNAIGGSSISQWSPNNTNYNYYKEAVNRAKQAQQHGRLKAILWHQGESDSSNPSGYCEKLRTIMDGLRSELSSPTVPVIAGEIADWHQNKDKFNPEIHRISEVISNSDYVSSAGCTWIIDASDPHFSRDGQILLGERYAEKVLKMCYGK